MNLLLKYINEMKIIYNVKTDNFALFQVSEYKLAESTRL